MPTPLGEAIFTASTPVTRFTIPGQDTSGTVTQSIVLPDPVLHPDALVKIIRARLRLHIVAYPRHIYSTELELVRTSDGAIIQNEYFAAGFFYEEGFRQSVAAADLSFHPDFFQVDLSTDSITLRCKGLFDVLRDSPSDIPRPLCGENLLAEAYTQYYYTLVAPRFTQVHWISTGNYLLGLKEDGTIWKSTVPGGNPLVWTEVWPT